LKIAYVTSTLPFGPPEAFLIPEVKELRRRGHDLLIVPMWPRGPTVHRDATEFSESVIRQPLLSPGIGIQSMLEALSRPVEVARVVATLRRSRSAPVLAKNMAVVPKALWLARLARAAQAEHIHVHWAASSATMGYIASALTGIPWSMTAHRWDIAENNLIREKVTSAKFIRAIDKPGAEELKALVDDPGKVHVIHMGVPLPSRNGSSAESSPRMRVVVAANLVEKKGHRYLMEAALVLKSSGVALTIECFGDGPLRARLESQCRSAGLSDTMRFLGVLGHEELLRRMSDRCWDAAVLPSIVTDDADKEGIPVFLIESMAAALPVVSTDTGGIPELLGNGAGILVPPKDAHALAQAILELARKPSLREHIGNAGAQRVREQFDVVATTSALLEAITA